ncbi:MAG: methyltransferase domain-containing protein [Dehalococcoidales bacterium]
MFFLNYSTVIDPLLRDIRTYTLEFSGMKAGDRALDVCCGSGAQALYYAREGVIATGIDLNPSMIELAQRGKKKSGLRDVSFQVADAVDLPFPDNSFDYASISLALHALGSTARDKVVSEMKRVVKIAGALIFIDFRVPLPRNAYGYLVRAAEFLVGGEHSRNSRDFLARGGLDEVLGRNQLGVAKKSYLKRGTIAIVKTGNV